MLRCRLLSHRYRFTAEGSVMRWDCVRCGSRGGSKTYDTPDQAARYAGAFDTEDRHDLGRRAPLIGLLPLRLWRALRRNGSEVLGRAAGGTRDGMEHPQPPQPGPEPGQPAPPQPDAPPPSGPPPHPEPPQPDAHGAGGPVDVHGDPETLV